MPNTTSTEELIEELSKDEDTAKLAETLQEVEEIIKQIEELT